MFYCIVHFIPLARQHFGQPIIGTECDTTSNRSTQRYWRWSVHLGNSLWWFAQCNSWAMSADLCGKIVSKSKEFDFKKWRVQRGTPKMRQCCQRTNPACIVQKNLPISIWMLWNTGHGYALRCIVLANRLQAYFECKTQYWWNFGRRLEP